MKKTIIVIIYIAFAAQFCFSQNRSISFDTISQYFNEAKKICDKDNGKLWGKPLWSPIIVINRNTRVFAANENDSTGSLKKVNDVYTGIFPENKIISNSTVEFDGKFWTMVSYPISNDPLERKMLFIHEMFHHLQKHLNLETKGGYDNKHMDKNIARVLIKLEWNALVKALNSKGHKQISAITDALIFRNYRRQIFPGADTNENRFEMQEGLADYTAIKLCLNDKNSIIKEIAVKKKYSWYKESYVRSFGYFSGACYAVLLDFSGENWKKDLNENSDLGELLKQHFKIKLPENLKREYDLIKNKYGFDSISVFENKREQRMKKVADDYREEYTVKPHLIIKLLNGHFGFSPSNLVSLDSLGTVYPFIVITDDWGNLNVNSNGCLLSEDWRTAIISSEDLKINGNIITGKDWVLKLNDKWKIETQGTNYILVKSE
jgi:hypothetical protein